MYKIERRGGGPGGSKNRSLGQTHYFNLLDVRESIDIKNRSLGNDRFRHFLGRALRLGHARVPSAAATV